MQLAQSAFIDHSGHQAMTLDLTPYGFDFQIKLHPWQQGLSLQRLRNNGTLEPLEGNLGFSIQQIAHTAGGIHWLNTIPPHLLDLVEPYPDTGIYMLNLAANNKRARELLQSRPVLLYLICSEYPVDREKAIALCQFGQREILNLLGFASSKAALRFLDRLQITFDNRSSHTLLRRLLHPIAERYRSFNHYPVVNAQALQLDMLLPALTGSRLALNLLDSRLKNRIRLPRLLNDTLRLGVMFGQADPIRDLRQLSSIEEVEALHDNWIRVQHHRDYQPCPTHDTAYEIVFNGNENIVPIRNFYELKAEGDEQLHCVGAYHTRILNDGYQVFKVMAPERVTIGITCIHRDDGTKYYDIDQVQAKRNHRPKESTLKTIYQWFESEKSAQGQKNSSKNHK